MHQIIYISQASRPFSEAELCALLQHARQANATQGITGALVYGKGQFMQVLEGERATIVALYARIAQDPRHTGVFKLTDEAIGQRRFGQWAMGFRTMAGLTELAGYQSPTQMQVALPSLPHPEAILLQLMQDLLHEEAASLSIAG